MLEHIKNELPENPDKGIGFIGQGWIGKNYADDFQARGFSVVRYALEEPYVKNGHQIKNCDIVFIAVPTPTTPQGFDDSILRQAIKSVGQGKIAVIKSTVLPGTTESIQKENPGIFVLHSPEFLTEATAAYDAANPLRNIIGVPFKNDEYRQKAQEVLDVLPQAPYTLVCSSGEAELIKYGGNNWFYFKVIFVNMLYDLAQKLGLEWENIRNAMAADPRIGSSHLNPVHRSGETGGEARPVRPELSNEARPPLKFNELHLEPVHKSGRGAGGHCFIKDFAAFSQIYNQVVGDELGAYVLESLKNKNIDLLVSSNKDLDLLAGVYGEEVIAKAASGQRQKRKVRCLVTGGAGFIGSNLVDELVRRNCEVMVIDNLSTGKRENLNPQAKFFEVDIRDLEKIKPIFEGVDFVFHLAALPRVQFSIDNPDLTNDVNVNGTLNVLIASRDTKVKKIIYSSSSSVYGDNKILPAGENLAANPISPYALQKYTGELYCRLFSKVYGLPTVCLRYFNAYGPRFAVSGAYALVMGIFISQRLQGQPLTITGDGEQRRDFTSVFDIVNANIMAANSSRVGQGEAINIGRGQNYSINELAQMIGGPVVYIEPRLEPRETLADISFAKELLGWEPKVNLADWVKEYKMEIGLE